MTGPVISGGKGGQVLVKRADSNMTDWSDAGYEKLTGDRTITVSPGGSDTSDGSAGHPFKTVQAAIDAISRLDVDGKYVITLQLAPGIYNENVQLKDPIGGDHRISYSPEYARLRHSAVLRGDPLSPESYSLAGITGINSQGWMVVGVRLDSPILNTCIYLDYGSYLIVEDIDFHIDAAMVSLTYIDNYSYLETGPLSEVRHCKISKGAGVGVSLLNVWYAYNYGKIKTGSDIDCTHAALSIDGIWIICDEHGSVLDYNNYLNSENFTGGQKWALSQGGELTYRRLTSIPGVVTNDFDHTSRLSPSNAFFDVTADMWPMIDPVGGPLIAYNPSQTLQSRYINRVISNQGATAITPYRLPGWENLYYYVGPPTGWPFGLKFSFVVQNAFGIRLSATGGMIIRNGAASGGKLESTVVGSTITLLNVSETEWMAIAALGTWTATAQLTNTTPPTVSPTTIAAGANIVTCAPGTWSAAAATVFYQWLRNGTPIASIDANVGVNATYNVQTETPGTVLTCRVSIIDAAGTGSVRVVSSNSCTVT